VLIVREIFLKTNKKSRLSQLLVRERRFSLPAVKELSSVVLIPV